MSEWHPIETAPKDGTTIRLKVPAEGMNAGFEENARWRSGVDEDGPYGFWSYGFGWLTHVKPTHWMPLPDPPK